MCFKYFQEIFAKTKKKGTIMISDFYVGDSEYAGSQDHWSVSSSILDS